MEKLWTFFPLKCNGGDGGAIAQYFHCSHIKNRMWSIYFELIIFPAADSSSAFNQIERKRAKKKFVNMCECIHESIERKHSVPFRLIDIYFCEFYDNAFDVWIWRMATALRVTQTHSLTEREKNSHLSNFIYWCWVCESSSSSLFFFVWFLIDWFLCVDSCIRESERMKDYSSVIRKTESDETMRKTFRFRITFAFQLLTNGK